MRRITNFGIIVMLFFGITSLYAQNCTKVTTGTNITMEDGSCIRSINGFNFILEADTTSTASLIDRNSSNHVTHASGSESKDEFYLTVDNWHLVSSPMQNEVSGVFEEMYLYDWLENTQSYQYIVSTIEPLTPMNGWFLWAHSAYFTNGNITYSGDFNTGDHTYNLTRYDPNAACPAGANLIGNPYPSALNWEAISGWTENNVGHTIYLWNSALGNYGTYNKSSDIGQNGVDSIIPANQGFYVGVTTGNTSGSITVGNDARVHCKNLPIYKNSELEFPNLLQINVNTDLTEFADETFVIFNEEASENFDDMYDAFKMKGDPSAPQLYTNWNNTKYAVNTLEEISKDLIIPLSFEAGINGVYTLNVNTLNLPFETEIYVEDLQLNKWQDLQAKPQYSFAANTQDEAGRFLLHFATPTAVEELENLDAINVFSFQKDVHINTPQGFKGEVKIYDMLGHEVLAKTIYNPETIITMNNPTGNYIVRLTTSKQTKTYKVYIK